MVAVSPPAMHHCCFQPPGALPVAAPLTSCNALAVIPFGEELVDSYAYDKPAEELQVVRLLCSQ